MTIDETAELITRRQKQVLVHAFMYYKMGTSQVSDAQYEMWWRELGFLQEEYRDIAENCPYWGLCAWIDKNEWSFSFEGQGFGVNSFPDEIKTIAVRLVAHETGKSFEEICKAHDLAVEPIKTKRKKRII